MTLESTDLHPSHKWKPESEDTRIYLFCYECYACSCCIGYGATGNCIGAEWIEKEVLNDTRKY